MITFNIIFSVVFCLWTLFCGWLFRKHTIKIKSLERKNAGFVNDINSLHRNQIMVASSIKELHRSFKQHDKEIKKQFRTTSRS